MERASHPSKTQLDNLLEFLEKNPSLAKGFSKTPSARHAQRKSWEALAPQLNSLGGCVKTWKQWTKYWADKKSATKKKGALRYRARNKTSGANVMVELSSAEERILTIMGSESCAEGDTNLRIHPFETSTVTGIPNMPTDLLSISTSPPHTPRSGSASPGLASTPSGSGAHPSQRNQPLSSTNQASMGPSSRTRLRSHRLSPSSEQQQQFSLMTERLLAVEEQRLQLDRRNSLAFETLVNHMRDRDTATAQGLLAVGEGLKVLAEALKMKIKEDVPTLAM